MGISCSQCECFQAKSKRDKLKYQEKRDKLNNLKLLLSTAIQEKEKEILEIPKSLDARETQIKKTEKALKNYPHDYESKKTERIEKLKTYLYDQQQDKIRYKCLNAYIQILKENLNNVEMKLMKLKNKGNLETINNIMYDVGEVDTKEDLEKNINLLLKEKKFDNEEIQIIDSGNKVLNSDMKAEIDNYVNNLFST